MKILTTSIFAIAIFSAHTVSTNAQFPISLPKIPKIEKKAPPPSTDEKRESNPSQTSLGRSVPQEYDQAAFERFANKREPLFGFVPCYARKHNLKLKDLVIYSDYFPYPAFDKYSPLLEQVAKQRKALAEIEQELKNRFATRPNTGKGPDSNPAIWEEITVNREEYIACALADFEERSDDARVSMFQDNVKQTLQDVREYSPQTRTSITSAGNWDWLERAISPSTRKEFLNKWSSLLTPKQRQAFERDLDAIAAALPPKVSAYTQAQINGFPFRNPVEERMMRAQLGDIAGLVVNKIGLFQNQWIIAKDQFGLPINRYKQGAIYGRNPGSDHSYCRLWYVNMIQDYSGGGTYAASYAKYVGNNIVTCPGN